MTQGTVLLPIIPVRFEPSGKSAMTNQLLYGDSVSIIETIPGWNKITSLHDNYEGWCESNQISVNVIDHEIYSYKYINSPVAVFNSGHSIYTLLFASRIPINGDNKPVIQGNVSELVFGELITIQESSFISYGEDILSLARSLIGAPYLWGGRSPFGIDCSGLIQLVFKMTGIQLSRDAWQQAENEGLFIDLIQESEAGDVAFFDNDEGRIIHTGILTGKGEIIHASGKVRIGPIDHHGIFNRDLGNYSHRLRIIKRFGSIL